jgi:hypothetical protein
VHRLRHGWLGVRNHATCVAQIDYLRQRLISESLALVGPCMTSRSAVALSPSAFLYIFSNALMKLDRTIGEIELAIICNVLCVALRVARGRDRMVNCFTRLAQH